MSDGSFNGHPFTIVRRDVVFGVALYTIGYLGGGYETSSTYSQIPCTSNQKFKREVK